MSLTSYRAAPPRAICFCRRLPAVFLQAFACGRLSLAPKFRLGDVSAPDCVSICLQDCLLPSNAKGRFWRPLPPVWRFSTREDFTCVSQTWQRLTLPRLETKYHQRWSVSRPSSEWDRVQPLRNNHQVSETHVYSRSSFERIASSDRENLLLPLLAIRWSLCAFSRLSPCEASASQGRLAARAKETSDDVRWTWIMRTIKPIELLVPVNFMRCRTSIPGLSTWSSSTALREYSF